VLCGGIYTTGSRGGLAAGLATLAIAILAQQRIRRAIVPFVLPAALVIAAMFVLHPNLFHSLLEHTRVLSVNGQESDAERKAVAVQALHDISDRPLIGVGFDVSDQGHSIYLQSIASGGILTLLGMIMYVVGTARTIRFRVNGVFDPLVSAATVSLISWLILGAIENDFADRYPYVPFAMLLTAWWLRTSSSDPPTDPLATTGELPNELPDWMGDADTVAVSARAASR
jgi:O-antigen ligase